MDNNFCFPFDHNFTIPNSIREIYAEKPYPLQTKVDKALFDSKIYDWLSCANIEVSWCEAHYKPALPAFIKNSKYGTVHADGDEIDNKSKINFVFGGTGSEMVWYKLNDESKIQKHFTGLQTASVRPIDLSTVTEVHRCGFKTALCNVGQLHSVENPNEERACIQFIIRDSNTHRRIEFIDARARIKELLKLL